MSRVVQRHQADLLHMLSTSSPADLGILGIPNTGKTTIVRQACMEVRLLLHQHRGTASADISSKSRHSVHDPRPRLCDITKCHAASAASAGWCLPFLTQRLLFIGLRYPASAGLSLIEPFNMPVFAMA